MRTRVVWGLLLFAALAMPAQAAPQQKVDLAKAVDIRRLLEVSGSKKLLEQVMTFMLEQIKPSVQKSLPPGERSQKILDTFFQRFQERFSSEFLGEEVISIYDRHLSAEDIRSLIQFYESPLGQRTLKALPQIARESQLAGSQLGQRIAQEVLQELQQEYPELRPGQKPGPGNP